jgi:hypothetical protein
MRYVWKVTIRNNENPTDRTVCWCASVLDAAKRVADCDPSFTGALYVLTVLVETGKFECTFEEEVTDVECHRVRLGVKKNNEIVDVVDGRVVITTATDFCAPSDLDSVQGTFTLMFKQASSRTASH